MRTSQALLPARTSQADLPAAASPVVPAGGAAWGGGGICGGHGSSSPAKHSRSNAKEKERKERRKREIKLEDAADPRGADLRMRPRAAQCVSNELMHQARARWRDCLQPRPGWRPGLLSCRSRRCRLVLRAHLAT